MRAKLAQTLAAKGWLIALYRYDGEQVHISRHTHEFPIADFETAVDLLESNLRQAAVTDTLNPAET